jgi:deoxyribodipyrimidine photolyase-related protein
MLNIGLLCPKKIIHLTIQYYLRKRGTIKDNNFEGFIRQIIGWREYMRYLYEYQYDSLIKSNLPLNTKSFDDWKPLYNGTTGIYPLDAEIKKAVKYGYSHHIVRLMVFLNYFILSEITPEMIYRWFMEVVSIDAYEWVMIPNIYGMGYFSNKFMSKPYISSSNYILKMSNYKKNNSWENTWNNLYREFVSSKPKAYLQMHAKYNK